MSLLDGSDPSTESEGPAVDYSQWPSWGVAFAAAGITVAAAATDYRRRRIPNTLTLSAFAFGLLFRVATGGGAGLLDAGLGFGVGFGTLFVLWICGGAGAGDVKLMGALGVWLGFSLTLSVLVLSVVVVCLLTLAAPLFSRQSTVVASTARPGDVEPGTSPPAADDSAGHSADEAAGSSQAEEKAGAKVAQKQRLTVAFASPLVVATWIVLALDFAGMSLQLV